MGRVHNSRLARLVALGSILSAAGLVAGYAVLHPAHHFDFALVWYVAMAVIVIGSMALALKAPTFEELPIPRGRVVAIVPTFNDSTHMLHACIESLLAGTIVPDVIYVVDDGSAVPAVEYHHPRVKWVRQPNQGKCHAQVNALKMETAYESIGVEPYEFVLTVDGDSIAHPDALEKCLRPFSDPDVHATTATTLVANRRQNILTLLTDLEFVVSCLVMRAAWSALGTIYTTSGAFALYRRWVIEENVDLYLNSGKVSDDRRLTNYAVMRGKAVAINEAYVDTESPHTIKTMFNQRQRWFKGYYRWLFWDMTYLPLMPVIIRTVNLVMLAAYPLLFLFVFVFYPISRGTIYSEGLAVWLVMMYMQTSRYLTERPNVPAWDRILTWLIGTPLLMPLWLFIVRPAIYSAVFKAKNLDWQTRGKSAQDLELETT